MPHSQRYVSSELCHFVGKGKTLDEQYDLLVNKIIKPGALTHGPAHDVSAMRGVNLKLSKSISTDEMLQYQVVCFCDIPIDDLNLHMKKYSTIGISFRKEFLIDRGACPVFYVCNESPVPVSQLFNPPDFSEKIKEAQANKIANRALFFDTSVRAIIDILAGLDAVFCGDQDKYFKNLDSTEFKYRLKILFGLSDAQLASIDSYVKGNSQGSIYDPYNFRFLGKLCIFLC